ncbi:hypothetical protein NQD34_013210 [Periophthalmus magnuspinnatus]|nr:hypothetical protein NQD34_013210 [Periophthalmus magnuspinnatus]
MGNRTFAPESKQCITFVHRSVMSLVVFGSSQMKLIEAGAVIGVNLELSSISEIPTANIIATKEPIWSKAVEGNVPPLATLSIKPVAKSRRRNLEERRQLICLL